MARNRRVRRFLVSLQMGSARKPLYMPRTIPREVRLQEFPSSLFVHPHVFVVLCDRAIHVEIFFNTSLTTFVFSSHRWISASPITRCVPPCTLPARRPSTNPPSSCSRRASSRLPLGRLRWLRGKPCLPYAHVPPRTASPSQLTVHL